MESSKLSVDRQPMVLHVETKPQTDISARMWEEVRTAGHHPSRRSYHSSVMWGEKMLVYGGQDLKEGPQRGLWQIEIGQFDQSDWEEIAIPDQGPVCRHTAIIKNNSMYVFGGTNGNDDFNHTLVFDLINLACRVITPDIKNCPPPLDSHSACLYEDGTASWMIVFGGYSVGERVNSVFSLNLSTEQWKQAQTSKGPEIRSSHSAVIFQNQMYVFGGNNEEGEKLNDLWRLDLRTYFWERINALGDLPCGRAGHSAVVYMDLMIIFGGMKDITKETNDMYSYNFTSNTWVHFQYESQIKDPVTNEQLEEYKKAKAANSPGKVKTESPIMKRNTLGDMSPTKITLKKADGTSPDPVVGLKKKKTLYDGPASPISGRIKARPPHPRDGHSAVISNNIMIIFGGDRHQMPFNDCYVYFLVENTIKTPLGPPL